MIFDDHTSKIIKSVSYTQIARIKNKIQVLSHRFVLHVEQVNKAAINVVLIWRKYSTEVPEKEIIH